MTDVPVDTDTDDDDTNNEVRELISLLTGTYLIVICKINIQNNIAYIGINAVVCLNIIVNILINFIEWYSNS